MPRSPLWLQWDAPYLPPKLPLPFDDLHPHLIHPPLDTPLTTPNGIQIQSAVFPQFTHRTDRQTNRQTDRQMRWATGLYRHPLTLYKLTIATRLIIKYVMQVN